MEYARWRKDVFGQPKGSDPDTVCLLSETHTHFVSPAEHFDHIDQALTDPEIHQLFDVEQIGVGLQLIFENSCSDICHCYVETGDEERQVTGIENLKNLYTGFFDRYCHAPVGSIGNDHLDGRIGYLCYMFWDVFVLHPGNATPAVATTALDVMADALRITNDNCLVSAIHGLGHWALDEPHAKQNLQQWLQNPTTRNRNVIEYAKQAANGYVL